MALVTFKSGFAEGGSGFTDLKKVLTELRGLTVSVVPTGAAAGTKMNVAALRSEDTLVAVVTQLIAGGAWGDDTANCTIADTHASGTITVATPVAANTVTLNGHTYTFAAAPGGPAYTSVSLGVSDTAAAANLAAAINAVDPLVHATSALGVVTVTAKADGVAGNAYTLTKVGSPISVSGATLSGGTVTGGIKSTTDLHLSTAAVFWFNKR